MITEIESLYSSLFLRLLPVSTVKSRRITLCSKMWRHRYRRVFRANGARARVFAAPALSINVTRLLISAIIVCVVFVQEFTNKQTEAIKTHAPSDHQ